MNDTTGLFALSLSNDDQPFETIQTAHERDMVRLRDRVAENSIGMDPVVHMDIIGTSEEVQEEMRVRRERQGVLVDAPPPNKPRVKKTATTAASFFTAKKASSSSKVKVAEKEKENLAIKEKKQTTTPAVGKKDAKPIASKKVGNVDDFLGDMDDDDDDERPGKSNDGGDPMEIEPVAPKPTRRKASKKEVIDVPMDVDEDNNSDNGEDKFQVSGAMDAFATVKKPTPPKNIGQKRRRKIVKEVTTVDEKGYLHTENQEVWEDIPEGEEEKAPVRSKTTSSSRTKPAKKAETNSKGQSMLKQNTLMGFFQKK